MVTMDKDELNMQVGVDFLDMSDSEQSHIANLINKIGNALYP